MGGEKKAPAPVAQPVFKTSKAGRDEVARFFVECLGRHDFSRYITDTLAADFACAIAPALHSLRAAPAPVAQLPEDFLDWARKRLTRERAEMVGFVAIGNELHRAATYDRWIAALNATPTRACQSDAPKHRAIALADDLDEWALMETEQGKMLRTIPALEAEVERLRAAPAPVAQAEFEVRDDGERVRVDRWEVGIRRIVALLWGNRHAFEVDEVVEAVRALVPAPNDDDEGLVRAVLAAPAPVAQPLSVEAMQTLIAKTPPPALDRHADEDSKLMAMLCAAGRSIERACAEAWGVKLVEATGQEYQPATGRPPAST